MNILRKFLNTFIPLLKSALKNKIFWYLACRYMVWGIQFLASIFLAVKLGAYYFGIWSFILLLVNIGSACNWGIGSAATILLVQNKEDQSLCSRYTFNSLLLVLLTFIPPVLIAVMAVSSMSPAFTVLSDQTPGFLHRFADVQSGGVCCKQRRSRSIHKVVFNSFSSRDSCQCDHARRYFPQSGSGFSGALRIKNPVEAYGKRR